MKNYIDSVQDKYDTIICHLLRSSQYLPDNFSKKTILDSTDLLSLNYEQSIKKLSIFNPLKYIYIIEKILVQRYEEKTFRKFNCIVFVSNKDAIKAKKKVLKKNKIIVIGNTKSINPKIFSYKKNNNKIIFIGNIKYLPNRLACNDFAKNILKKINYKYPDIQFHIIGDIGYINKFILNKYKNVIVHGKVKELKNILKNSICGLCNVEIATGFQNKILSYMSFGIPTVIRTNPNIEKKFKNGKEVLLSKNTDELINKIIQLKKNKKLANKLSINSQMLIKKKYSNKVLLKYSKII
jgi:glycosyltransferase involved in cell wall biosynthesis